MQLSVKSFSWSDHFPEQIGVLYAQAANGRSETSKVIGAAQSSNRPQRQDPFRYDPLLDLCQIVAEDYQVFMISISLWRSSYSLPC